MQQKKRKTFKLHSIPIVRKFMSKFYSEFSNNLCREKLYLVSYSIPLSCMVVLLLGGIVAVNPSLSLKTSAVTIQDEWVVKESEEDNDSISEDNSTDTSTNTPNSTISEDMLDSNTTNDAIDDNVGNSNNPDDGIMPLADNDPYPVPGDSTIPSISITVSTGTGGNGGRVDQVVNAFQGGSTVYRSHNVTVSGKLLKDYSLVLTGPTNLNKPSGASSTSTITGASGKTGSNMTTNTWGYAWGNTTDTDSNMTYNSLSSSGKSLTGASIASDKSLNFTKKLVFAAKFGDVTPGNYTADVTLSIVATPAITATMSNITNMQDMTPEICEGSDVGQTATLKDSRDNNSYNIVKLEDNRCWMQQNLRLTGNRTLTSSNSDVSSNWSMPASLTSLSSTNFSSSDYYKAESYYQSGTLSTNGVYYSFTAATAGTATSSVTSGETTSSVCPKGWKLPTKSEYENMLSKAGIANSSAGSTKIRNAPYSFPYAGYVSDGSLNYAGSGGYYWSRTVGNSYGAYDLYFNSSDVAMDNNARYNGFSVRCVANS